jgi:prepilin-type N-terminal cleavage/methylation domain-containing protein
MPVLYFIKSSSVWRLRGMTLIELLAVIGILTIAVAASGMLGERFGGWGYAAGAILGLSCPLLAIEAGNRMVNHRRRPKS